MTPDAPSLRQIQAADPAASSWVSANAGSGKTRVLTNRVARMLYNRIRPERILCLTYTKAAASEMQIRLFDTLGAWAMATDGELTAALTDLGEPGPFSSEDLARARQMFATAIETPGGLKIQTIHAFCASILRQFPLEAGVSPNFRELDDSAATDLRSRVLNQMADEVPKLLDALPPISLKDLNGLADRISRRSWDLTPADPEEVWRAFDLPPGFGDGDVGKALAFDASDYGALKAMASAPFDKPTDIKNAKKLADALSDDEQPDLGVLESVFLTSSGASPYTAKIGKVPTKGGRDLVPEHVGRIDDLMIRVEAARPLRMALASARRTHAFLSFADEFSKRYEAAKLAAGLLDFDDLISRTLKLLSQSSSADWVMYRLDGGIDHILVDEAQDTSPRQWDVIDAFAREFTVGISARETERTIFVVGDKKQSIYSFQGADPKAFDEKRKVFSDRLDQLGERLNSIELSHSFRSAPAILTFVDTALGPVKSHGIGDHLDHIAFQDDRPGRVDLWPLIQPDGEKPPFPPLEMPVDMELPNHPAKKLAKEIAGEVAAILSGDQTITDRNGVRPITPGDFLILVQRRSLLFREILRNLKALDLPVAGSDVLYLDQELAVQDLLSLLKFLASPQDDLSLAEVMRSPILGMSEQDLFRAAESRDPGLSLWHALQRRTDATSPAIELLSDMLSHTEYSSPFDLLERVLNRHGARQNLIGRLGLECEEGVDALLTRALRYEATHTPSLIGFLDWLDSEDGRIKRETDGQGDLIRVMTAHGAKGLESPIVILPDTGRTTGGNSGPQLLWDDKGPIWKPLADSMDARSTNALRARSEAEAEERNRLLYVAMTRAESWLILCGAGKEADGAWYQLAADGMDRLPTTALAHRDGLRFSQGTWPAPAAASEKSTAARTSLPLWIDAAPPPRVRPGKVLAPSDLGGDKVLTSDQDAQGGADRGTAIHTLLEHFAPGGTDDNATLAKNVLGDRPDLADIVSEVQGVMSNPDLAFLFDASAKAEVPISASLPEINNRRISGAIDRLVVDDERVLIVDFKSNAHVPQAPEQTPEGILRQMGAYAAALAQIYPDYRIETAIVWTKTAQLMPLAHDLVSAALSRTPPP